MGQLGIRLPQYVSHKTVCALKITDVAYATNQPGAHLHHDTVGVPPIAVDSDYLKKHMPLAGGYYVRYEDGYESFSPAQAFESSYTKMNSGEIATPNVNMSFGQAIEELKAGRKVWRSGWNGKGMWLILVPGQDDCSLQGGTPYDKALNCSGRGQTHVSINPRIDMFTADGKMQPGWLASQTDMLANDWQSNRIY